MVEGAVCNISLATICTSYMDNPITTCITAEIHNAEQQHNDATSKGQQEVQL